MSDRRSFLTKAALLAAGTTIVLPSCKSVGTNNVSYKASADFSPEKFNFLKSNESNGKGGVRTEGHMLKHKPELKAAKNGKEFFVDFKSGAAHPHLNGHWWSWIEVVDTNGNMGYAEFPEPAEGETIFGKSGVEFVGYVQCESPLSGTVRVRAWCESHGEFTNYVNI